MLWPTPAVASRAHRSFPNFRKHIEPALGALPLGKITPDRVRQWHADLRYAFDGGSGSGRGAPTVRNAYNLLKALLRTAEEDGLIAKNPCRIQGASRPVSPERPLMTCEDAAAIAGEIAPHLRVAVLTAWWAHLRLGELVALRWEDVDLTAGRVHVHRQIVQIGSTLSETPTKAHLDRQVDIPDIAIEMLREHLSSARLVLPSARVFSSAKGGVLTPHAVGQAWNRARAKADRPRFHLHDLRHGSLTLAAQSGATTYEVMRRAGHRTLAAALTYQHEATSRGPLIAAAMATSSEAKATGPA